VLINALARGEELEEPMGRILRCEYVSSCLILDRRSVDAPALSILLERAVAQAPWVTKYKEEGRFGLPLDSADPLVAMQRE